jgi:hypothetical protein
VLHEESARGRTEQPRPRRPAHGIGIHGSCPGRYGLRPGEHHGRTAKGKPGGIRPDHRTIVPIHRKRICPASGRPSPKTSTPSARKTGTGSSPSVIRSWPERPSMEPCKSSISRPSRAAWRRSPRP